MTVRQKIRYRFGSLPIPTKIIVKPRPWRAVVDFVDKETDIEYYGLLFKNGKWDCDYYLRTDQECSSKREAIGRIKKHFVISKTHLLYPPDKNYIVFEISGRRQVPEYHWKIRLIRFCKRTLNKINAKYYED